MQVEVRTAPEQLQALNKALKQAGQKDLKRELNGALRRAAKPMQAQARINYAKRLPREGGLAKKASRARMSVAQKRTLGGAPSLQLVSRHPTGQKMDMRAIDAGLIRHKTFGRLPWHVQRIDGEAFADAVRAGEDEGRAEIERAITTISRKLEALGVYRGVT